MKKRLFMITRAEEELALTIVNYVVDHSTIKSDEDGIFLEVEDFLEYIPAEDIPTLIKLLQRRRIYPNLDDKIIEAITEE